LVNSRPTTVLGTRGADGIGRHVSGIVDPFNGHIDEFRIAHVQRSDGWVQATWNNNMSDPGAFAVAGAEEQQGGEPPPLAGAGIVVCLSVNVFRTCGGAGSRDLRWPKVVSPRLRPEVSGGPRQPGGGCDRDRRWRTRGHLCSNFSIVIAFNPGGTAEKPHPHP
jgi:hypothetical protein